MITQKYIARFHTKYTINPDSGCWEWPIAKSNRYGLFWVNQEYILAHRFSAMIHGLDMTQPVMRHKCDNPACVNPDHLETGTHQDNMDDRTSRGRQSKGITHGCSVLTEAQVLAIRAEYAANPVRGMKVRLAKKYNINVETLTGILSRKYWKHI